MKSRSFVPSLVLLVASLLVSALSLDITANSGLVFVTGATSGLVQGGTATASTRCAYYYSGDNSAHSFTPTYPGSTWPVVQLPIGEISITAPFSLLFLVTVGTSGIVRINGLPLYQFAFDSTTNTCSGHSSSFPAINVTNGLSSDALITPVNDSSNIKQITVTSSDAPPPAVVASSPPPAVVASPPPAVVAAPPPTTGSPQLVFWLPFNGTQDRGNDVISGVAATIQLVICSLMQFQLRLGRLPGFNTPVRNTQSTFLMSLA